METVNTKTVFGTPVSIIELFVTESGIPTGNVMVKSGTNRIQVNVKSLLKPDPCPDELASFEFGEPKSLSDRKTPKPKPKEEQPNETTELPTDKESE